MCVTTGATAQAKAVTIPKSRPPMCVPMPYIPITASEPRIATCRIR
jgi:hypothetical protein